MSELVEMARAGASSREIARQTGLTPLTVRRRVRKLMPHAFMGRAPFAPAEDAVARVMPHQIGWSTDPVSHHAVSLPRLRELAARNAIDLHVDVRDMATLSAQADVAAGTEATYFGGEGPASSGISRWAAVTGMSAAELITVAGAHAVRGWEA